MRRATSRAIMILGIATGIPTASIAEGARTIFDCTINSQCDAGGSCIDLETPLVFTLAPIALDTLGAGRYEIAYADIITEMTAVRAAGPFAWQYDDRELTLTPTLDDQRPVEMILFSEDRLGLDPSTTTFLTCEVTQ